MQFFRCGEQFTDLKCLHKHIHTQHESISVEDNSNKKNYVCEICCKSFTLKQNLNRHMQVLHKIDTKLPPATYCPLCDSVFSTIVILSKHLVENHGVELKEADLVFDSLTGD